jgi:hypothetical protein
MAVLSVAVAVVQAGWAPARAAYPVRDPDWPCQAIKVPDLSLGAIWNGPAVDADSQAWSRDPRVAGLVERLVQRRFPIEQARADIKAAALAAGPARQTTLLLTLVGVFQTLGRERGEVLDGLDRYGKRQKQLAEQVRGEGEALRQMQAQPQSDPARMQQMVERITWDTRVFEDRRQMLSAACDVPTSIEQRLYAIAQAIQAAL